MIACEVSVYIQEAGNHVLCRSVYCKVVCGFVADERDNSWGVSFINK